MLVSCTRGILRAVRKLIPCGCGYRMPTKRQNLPSVGVNTAVANDVPPAWYSRSSLDD